ncbi:hypothetical protein BACI349Y_50410 [Bacillus sp. 349Y]|nr:hypothetical protein BACI349Y_50410 [Bacillus sp. 349Y]
MFELYWIVWDPSVEGFFSVRVLVIKNYKIVKKVEKVGESEIILEICSFLRTFGHFSGFCSCDLWIILW